MPTYEYRCDKCNQTFDAFQSMKDAHYLVCPEKLCRLETWGEGSVKRLLGTGAGLIFKGSGFYITDYRSAGYKEAAKKESGASEAPKNTPATPAGGSASTGKSGEASSKGSSDSGKSSNSSSTGGTSAPS